MKQSEIEVGGEYITRIGDALTRVRVVAAVERGTFTQPLKKLIRFRIARCDAPVGVTLPKLRTAAALRRPALDPVEAQIFRDLKWGGADRERFRQALGAYRFLRAVGCPQ